MVEGPHGAFVDRLHRTIARFAEEKAVPTPIVTVELADGSRFTLDRIEPEPGFGLVTMYVHTVGEREPDAIIVPLATIARLELRAASAEPEPEFGFAVPPPRAD